MAKPQVIFVEGLKPGGLSRVMRNGGTFGMVHNAGKRSRRPSKAQRENAQRLAALDRKLARVEPEVDRVLAYAVEHGLVHTITDSRPSTTWDGADARHAPMQYPPMRPENVVLVHSKPEPEPVANDGRPAVQWGGVNNRHRS